MLVAGGLLAFLALSFLGDQGLGRLYRMSRHRDDLKARAAAAEAANAALAREIRLLREDPAVQEEMARVRLGMVRPGEVVYVFSPAAEAGTK